MWRDRTNLYISYRQSYSHHPVKRTRYTSASDGFGASAGDDDERRGLMSGGGGSGFDDDNGDAVIEMDLLPPRWLDAQDEVTEVLATIATKSAKLEKLHQKHVLPGFGDESARKEEEYEIERLTQEITRGYHTCQNAVKRIDTMVKESKMQDGLSSSEETMARNLQISIASRVQESSANFRKKQSNYLKKLRSLGGLASPLDRSSTPQIQNPYTDPSLMESEVDKSYSESTLLQTQQLQRRPQNAHDHAIAQREREINEIAQGIIELADIFRDLQAMVIDQGTMLDRIDYNVEKMGHEVKGAEKELVIATNYQRRSTKRKIILLLLLIVIGMFILVLVKPKNSSSNNTSPPATPPSTNDPIDTPADTNPDSADTSIDGIARILRRNPEDTKWQRAPDGRSWRKRRPITSSSTTVVRRRPPNVFAAAVEVEAI